MHYTEIMPEGVASRYQRALIIGLLFPLLMGVSMRWSSKPEKIKIFNASTGGE